ncbi:MAG: DUF5908 family protein [Ferruginibacter sp.]
MPVEIMEIVIRATVQEAATPQQTTAPAHAVADPGIKRQDLVRECVEQVLEILRHQKER